MPSTAANKLVIYRIRSAPRTRAHLHRPTKNSLGNTIGDYTSIVHDVTSVLVNMPGPYKVMQARAEWRGGTLVATLTMQNHMYTSDTSGARKLGVPLEPFRVELSPPIEVGNNMVVWGDSPEDDAERAYEHPQMHTFGIMPGQRACHVPRVPHILRELCGTVCVPRDRQRTVRLATETGRLLYTEETAWGVSLHDIVVADGNVDLVHSACDYDIIVRNIATAIMLAYHGGEKLSVLTSVDVPGYVKEGDNPYGVEGVLMCVKYIGPAEQTTAPNPPTKVKAKPPPPVKPREVRSPAPSPVPPTQRRPRSRLRPDAHATRPKRRQGWNQYPWSDDEAVDRSRAGAAAAAAAAGHVTVDIDGETDYETDATDAPPANKRAARHKPPPYERIADDDDDLCVFVGP